MKRSKFQLYAISVLMLTCTSVVSASSRTMCEKMIRHDVIKKKMPQYPKEALESGAQGVVVVAVVFGEDGDLSKFEVMEAPHPSIKEAVAQVIKKWRVKPSSGNFGPVTKFGWLSFEYVIEEGVGRVGYTTRSDEDCQEDKRYVHPFSPDAGKFPFYYQYMVPTK